MVLLVLVATSRTGRGRGCKVAVAEAVQTWKIENLDITLYNREGIISTPNAVL